MHPIFTSLKKTNYKHKRQKISIHNYPFLADNTNAAYNKGWQSFVGFCGENKSKPLPANQLTVCRFLKQQSGRVSLGTVDLYLSAINKVHVINGYSSFSSNLDIKNMLALIRRSSDKTPRRVRALVYKDLQHILDKMPQTLIAKRDAAILSIGFAAALRRSEICSLKLEDIKFIKSGNKPQILLNIRRSKTDQRGLGYEIGIMDGDKLKPIQKLLVWLEASGIKQGYLFRSMTRGGSIKLNPLHHSDIPRLVKYYVASIGLNPAEYAGHSLRAGFITSAAIYGARLDKIMEISRHKTTNIVMNYIRDNNLFKNHAGKDFL